MIRVGICAAVSLFSAYEIGRGLLTGRIFLVITRTPKFVRDYTLGVDRDFWGILAAYLLLGLFFAFWSYWEMRWGRYGREGQKRKISN